MATRADRPAARGQIPRRGGHHLCRDQSPDLAGIDVVKRPNASPAPSCWRRSRSTRNTPQTEKVRIDVLRRFGYYSTESNGHLSEYLPWYRKRVDEIPRWISMKSWIDGETGGYLRVCTEGRNWFESGFGRGVEGASDAGLRTQGTNERARKLYHRGLRDRPGLPGAFQPAERRDDHEPAAGRHHREPGLCRPPRFQPSGRRRPAPGLRRHLQCLDLRPAPRRRGGGPRRRHASAPGLHARSADRRRLQPAGDLAAGR